MHSALPSIPVHELRMARDWKLRSGDSLMNGNPLAHLLTLTFRGRPSARIWDEDVGVNSGCCCHSHLLLIVCFGVSELLQHCSETAGHQGWWTIIFTYLKFDVEWFLPSKVHVRPSSGYINRYTIEILLLFVIPFVVFHVPLLRIPLCAFGKVTGPDTDMLSGYFYNVTVDRTYYATYVPEEYHSLCTVSKWFLISCFFRNFMPQQIGPFALLAYYEEEWLGVKDWTKYTLDGLTCTFIFGIVPVGVD